ncbi:DUF421 domain-containing protein [Roseomonas sp. OT10]|uniref:DUF421 domain-containing protein n=1 Tax=Roseomonas cutis TaxID=2897332 RepID=UPI001E38CCA6|nr:YetF domain-containing protein [Roseomonas sp. OT10]UFN50044.1 DUF421 domain-containing protein [Roseomonas sp. OT10]
MIETVLRAALTWAGLMVLLRLSGRRTLGEMSPADFVVLLIIGDMVQQGLLGDDASLTSGFVVVTTLLLLTVLYATAKARWPGLTRPMEGVPTVLVREGVPDLGRLRRSRVALDDVLEAARQNGIAELGGVRWAILETSGRISIIPRASPQEGEQAGETNHPPR